MGPRVPLEVCQEASGFLTPRVDPTASLTRLMSEARVTEAGRSRARRHWLGQQALEETTLLSTLVDLAEAGTNVVVHTAGGRRRAGLVVAVGTDFVALRNGGNCLSCVSFSGIGAVRTKEPGSRAHIERSAQLGTDLRTALADFAADSLEAIIWLSANAEPIRGQLRAVGTDLVMVDTQLGREHCYVRVASVEEVSVVVSG
ncbi:MAG: hypothetical protein EDR02_16665 [Actinobacteria bacterium]|nr:MAG: hypothetical protein EDR02_16665 [Actinomycetota bacterium]RIK07490.1 MAG: hypothetical protein DCC48_03025 [Acidobacteriota bacterium]